MGKKLPKREFEHPAGRLTRVEINEGKRLGSGGFGEIHETVAAIGNRRVLLVLKKFRHGFDAKEAFHSYKAAKKAGLKVFPTYRLEKDGRTILMTAGSNEEWICIGSNPGSNRMENFGERKMESVENIDEITDHVFAQAEKATESNISLHADAFFFMVDRETKKKLSFVIGDFDNVRLGTDFPYETPLFIKNMDCAYDALCSFIATNVSNPESYLRQCETMLDKRMIGHEPWNIRRASDAI